MEEKRAQNIEMSKDVPGVQKTLGPVHVWALGVGIVLVGEFMGWNLTIKQGGTMSALIGLFLMSIMYMGQVMMVSEIATVLPEDGGQYTMAKYLLGPLAAFNVGLMAVLEYAMLEAGDVIVVGQLLNSLDGIYPAFSAGSGVYQLPRVPFVPDHQFLYHGGGICHGDIPVVFHTVFCAVRNASQTFRAFQWHPLRSSRTGGGHRLFLLVFPGY